MSKKELLISEIESFSEPVIEELLDFASFLKSRKTRDGIELAVASESALGKDWLRPEEDQAWQGL